MKYYGVKNNFRGRKYRMDMTGLYATKIDIEAPSLSAAQEVAPEGVLLFSLPQFRDAEMSEINQSIREGYISWRQRAE